MLFNALADTGASISFVTSEILDACGILMEPYRGNDFAVTPAGVLKFIGKQHIDITINNITKRTCIFVIRKNDAEEFVIGNDVLKSFKKVTFDYENDSLRFGQIA